MLTIASNLSSTVAEFVSPALVGFTKVLNKVGSPNLVDSYMDKVPGIAHRVKHGHDLSGLPTIFDKFGFDGVVKFFKHNLGADIMSPHGIPVIPFTNEIGKALGLSPKEIVDWMCLNIGDVFSGSLAVTNSYFNYKLIMTGTPGGKTLILILISSCIKLSTSTVNPNPITFLSSAFDIGLVAHAGMPILMDQLLPRYSFQASAFGSFKAGSLSFTASLLSLGAFEWYKKRNLVDIDYEKILRESSITGLSASVASMIYDSSKHLITENKVVSSVISLSSFFAARNLLEKVITSYKPIRNNNLTNSDQLFNPTLIPAF